MYIFLPFPQNICMKKFVLAALGAFGLCLGCAVVPAGNARAEEGLVSGCKSACLIDAGSGEVIYELNSLERMPIASVCKVMTLTLVFEAVEGGKLHYGDQVCVSERAAGMGGSQVFLQSGLNYTVDELIKSVVVCSANDSCVALAEAVSGSEESFVAAMNERAERLGCRDTLFANCTGLPKQTQYSCARDVAIMFANLTGHEKYFDYSSIWLEDFVHPDGRTTSMTNTNKLIRRYSACDGGKTGFTNEAGFCLASTAERDNLRLVSAVLGGGTSDARFDSSENLLNYGFANYCNKMVLDSEVNINDRLSVLMGVKESVCVRAERDSFVFCRRGEQPEISFVVSLPAAKAPVFKGDVVGRIEVYRDGVMCDSLALVCSEQADRAKFSDNWHKIADNWCM